MSADFSQLATTFSQLPQCATSILTNGISESTCGLNIACVCQDDKFLNLLQSQLTTSCNRNDLATTLSLARSLCISAIPSLVETKDSQLFVTIAVIMAIASVSVILRLCARKIAGCKLESHDYLIIVALVFAWGLDINSFYSVKSGAGHHAITLSLDSLTSFIKTDEATQILFGCSITAIKLSVIFFYRRLFFGRTFVILSTTVAVMNVLWWIGLMLTAFLHCHPLAFYWDRTIHGGTCVNDNSIAYSITAVDVVFDIVILVLPIPWLWGLQMPPVKRTALIALFLLGSLYVASNPVMPPLYRLTPPSPTYSVCVAGIIRLPFLAELKLSDVTWTSTNAGIWVLVECNIGILSACLPLMRPLFTAKYPASPISGLKRLIKSVSESRWSGSTQRSTPRDPEKGGDSSTFDSNPTFEKTFRASAESYDKPDPGFPRGSIYTMNRVRETVHPKVKSHKAWYDTVSYNDRWPQLSVRESLHNSGDEEWARTAAAQAAQAPKQQRKRWIHTSPISWRSRRNSWGRSRDTWNLMPSVVLWNKESLAVQ